MLFLIYALINKSQIKHIVVKIFKESYSHTERGSNEMLENISELLTNLLLNNNIISESDFKWKKYGIQLFLTQIFCFLCSILFCSLIGHTKECVLFLLFLMPIRSCIGGIHARRFSTCFLLSNLIVILGSKIIFWGSHFHFDTLLFAYTIIGITTGLFLWFEKSSLAHLPKSEQNMDSIIRRKKFLLIIFLLISVLSIYTKANSCFMAIICSLLCSTFTIIAQFIFTN